MRSLARRGNRRRVCGCDKTIVMATYLYETIPQKKGVKPRSFELVQKMTDAALTHDPKTGEPVRRIILGGSGPVTRGTSILSMNNPRKGRRR